MSQKIIDKRRVSVRQSPTQRLRLRTKVSSNRSGRQIWWNDRTWQEIFRIKTRNPDLIESLEVR